jgi:transcriptional regulator with XRE-family HTH domain
MGSDYVNSQLLVAHNFPLPFNRHMEAWNDRLRRLRAATGLSQAKVAKALGIAPASVAHWELGRSRPDPDRFSILATLYNTTIAELCGSDLPQPSHGDRVALLRLYDELDDDARANLLKTAVLFRKAMPPR